MTLGRKRVPLVQLAAIGVAAITAAVALVYWVKAISSLGDRAGANSRLSYADREIAGGNSVVVDQEAAYRAQALIPRRGRYRVVTGSALQNATPLTFSYVADWFRYFLMPRRPSPEARWVICYGCDAMRLGSHYAVRWHDADGISIGLVQ